jgi:hypothetical protein
MMDTDGTRIRPVRSRTYRIRLTADDVTRLLSAADRRGVYPETLLTEISRTVLRDRLVNAVLDDEVGKPSIARAGHNIQCPR